MLQQHSKEKRAGLHGLRMFVQLATAPKATREAMAAHRPRTAAEVTVKGTLSMAKRILATLPTAAPTGKGKTKVAAAAAAVTVTEMAALISNVHNNSFFVTDVEGRRLASAYYGAAALLNHSCSPNAIAGFTAGSIEIRTTKLVPKGSELLISYTELYGKLLAGIGLFISCCYITVMKGSELLISYTELYKECVGCCLFLSCLYYKFHYCYCWK